MIRNLQFGEHSPEQWTISTRPATTSTVPSNRSIQVSRRHGASAIPGSEFLAIRQSIVRALPSGGDSEQSEDPGNSRRGIGGRATATGLTVHLRLDLFGQMHLMIR
jgi:hypothetical protein